MLVICRRDKNKATIRHHDRHDDTGTAAPLHVAHQGQGDEARTLGAAVAVGTRVSLQAQREVGAGEAGHRAAALQDGDIRQWLLLAWAQRAN